MYDFRNAIFMVRVVRCIVIKLDPEIDSVKASSHRVTGSISGSLVEPDIIK